jgi:hypothetical protein
MKEASVTTVALITMLKILMLMVSIAMLRSFPWHNTHFFLGPNPNPNPKLNPNPKVNLNPKLIILSLRGTQASLLLISL